MTNASRLRSLKRFSYIYIYIFLFDGFFDLLAERLNSKDIETDRPKFSLLNSPRKTIILKKLRGRCSECSRTAADLAQAGEHNEL